VKKPEEDEDIVDLWADDSKESKTI